MNDRLPGALRQTFEQIADDGPPPSGLVRAALAGARRRRRAQFGAGIAAVLCAALAAGVAVDGDRGTQIATGPGASVVVAYSDIRDAEATDPSEAFHYSLLLDASTGEYSRVPYRSVVPSPDGDRVLVAVGDDTRAHPTRVGIMDRETRVVRWIEDGQVSGFPASARDGVWSPDGRRILFRVLPKGGQRGAVVVDAETLRAQVVALPELSLGEIRLEWTPDGDGFVVTLADQPDAGGDFAAREVQFFGLDGQPGRTLRIPDDRLWATPFFSPGGDRLALNRPGDSTGPLSIMVVDPETGDVGTRINLAEFGEMLGWVDQEQLLVRTRPRDGGTEWLQVIDMRGSVTKRLRLPDTFAETIHVGSAAGLPDSAAGLTF